MSPMGDENLEGMRELRELARAVDSDNVILLRDKHREPQRTRQALERHSPHLWLFPRGIFPKPEVPVQVFRNGLGLWMGEEARIFRAGSGRRQVWGVLLDTPTREEDVIQATYWAAPVTE